jgi:hypothetical protein
MLSQNRRAYSGSTGRVAEVRFVRAAEALGLQVKKSSRSDDINRHVDYWMAYGNVGRWGVDVKGNNLPDEIWVELMNVGGNPGWLHGDAKIIAFDMPEEGGFSVVDRFELKKWVDQNVELEHVTHKNDAYRKLYRRKDRQDLITKLTLQDLRKLESYRVWRYFDDY